MTPEQQAHKKVRDSLLGQIRGLTAKVQRLEDELNSVSQDRDRLFEESEKMHASMILIREICLMMRATND